MNPHLFTRKAPIRVVFDVMDHQKEVCHLNILSILLCL